LMSMDMNGQGPFISHIEEILRAGRSAASLTRQLLAFSRKQVVQPQVMNLNDLLGSLEKMLLRLIGEDIEIRTLKAPDLWPIMMDAGQLEQVIMNLVVNARDAMPKGGRLTIETANVGLDEHYFREHGLEPITGPFVMLTVSDTGIGMDKETQSRIFDPFFTTKEMGRGTGLGLATAYGIVKQAGGYIWVYSEPGQGATFKIYLPRAEGIEETAEAQLPPPEKITGTETILVVEDDEMLRGVIERMLREYGYRVLMAKDGKEATEISEGHVGDIALLLTDVVLPGQGGKELADALLKVRSEMKVLFMSGYTDNAIAHRGVLEPGLHFIPKPFSPEALARKVREALA
ncbi:MAG: ATP-binding protein, partial [Pseudomonadota bacterium]